MIQSEEDKKLVDQYKQTNLTLRKQLNALNDEVDRLLLKKSNKVGLEKLPSVQKKFKNVNVIQQEVDTLRKRLEFLEREKQIYQQKASINYHEKLRQINQSFIQKELEEADLRKNIKQYERKDKIANTHQNIEKEVSANHTQKKIQFLQEQITRYQKMESEVLKQINYQAANQYRNQNYLSHLVNENNHLSQKSLKKLKKLQQSKSKSKEKEKEKQTKKGVKKSPKKKQITEEDWKNLKRDFLLFKESKQIEEQQLNEQNQELRLELRDLERKLKEKKQRIESIRIHNQKATERSRVSSTIEVPNRAYRYRGRNNSIIYHTKQ